MKKLTAILLVALAPVLGTAAIDPTPATASAPLTLDQCLAIATDHQPALMAAQAGVNAATQAVGEARAPYFPQVDVNAGYHRFQKRAFFPSGLSFGSGALPTQIGPLTDWTAGLSSRFTVFDFGARKAGLKAAEARKVGAEAEASATASDVRLSVEKAFYTLAAAQDLQTVAEKNLARTREHLKLAEVRRAAGAVPQADVLRMQAEVANAELQLISMQSQVRISTGRLNTAMGLAAETPLQIALMSDPPTPPAKADLGTAIEQALARRPELTAAEKRTDAARAALTAARASRAPRLFADAAYGWNDTVWTPETKEWQAGLSIDMPLFDAGSRQYRVARSRADVAREEAVVENQRLQIRQEVWAAAAEVDRSWASIAANQAALKASAESMRVMQTRYENGAAVITDLLDTQTALARAEASLAGAKWDYMIARATYERAIGGKP